MLFDALTKLSLGGSKSISSRSAISSKSSSISFGNNTAAWDGLPPPPPPPPIKNIQVDD